MRRTSSVERADEVNAADVIVIGGGIAGASVAFELADSASVLLLERESAFDVHATGRSAAVFRQSASHPQLRALATASRSRLETPPDGFTDHPILAPLGLFTPATTGRRHDLMAFAEGLPEGVEVRVVEGDDVRAICPVLSPDYVVGALETDAKAVDVHALHQGFLTGLRARGGRALRQTGVSGLARAGTLWNVHAGEETFSAPVVVDAAGAWSDEVATMADVAPLGLTAQRRTVFMFSPPDGHDVTGWPMVREIDEQFYFRPEGAQMLGSPCDETPMAPTDARHEEIDVAMGIDRIQQATSMTIRHVPHAWAGLRTFAPDRTPVCGFDSGHPGFFWLAGQGGNGIQISWALARLAAAQIDGSDVPEELLAAGVDADALSPARFA